MAVTITVGCHNASCDNYLVTYQRDLREDVVPVCPMCGEDLTGLTGEELHHFDLLNADT